MSCKVVCQTGSWVCRESDFNYYLGGGGIVRGAVSHRWKNKELLPQTGLMGTAV
jgi:hypothetical protein